MNPPGEPVENHYARLRARPPRAAAPRAVQQRSTGDLNARAGDAARAESPSGCFDESDRWIARHRLVQLGWRTTRVIRGMDEGAVTRTFWILVS